MKTDKFELLKSIREMLKKPLLNPSQLSGIGEEVYILKKVFKLEENIYQDILNEYMNIIRKLDLHDLLKRQIEYAIRIAESRKDLIYEDMFKLFCLCDEIMGLKGIGFKIEESMNNELNEALKYRFRKESKKAKLVAGDLYEDWKKKYWWYSKNLEHT